MPYLILFDIDGTILRYKEPLSQSLVNYVTNNLFHKSINKSYHPDFSGKTDLMIIHEICDAIECDFNEVLKNLNSIWSNLLEFFKKNTNKYNIIVFPGIYNLLLTIKNDSNYQLGLVTGNFKDNAYLKLSAVDLAHYFPFGAFGSDYEDRNLLPKLAIQRANKYLGKKMFSIDNTIIIGDSLRDIECAKNNKIKVVSVATGPISFELLKTYEPDLIFRDFKNFKLVFKKIKNLFEKNEKNNYSN